MSAKHKVYVAGPMRGIPEFNFPAFFAAADKLRGDGFAVFNPAERDNEHRCLDGRTARAQRLNVRSLSPWVMRLFTYEIL